MTDAGFFRGTSSEQDNRFSDKEKKLLKQMKFADNLTTKIEMNKIKIDVLKPWIGKRISELLGMEDDVVTEFVVNQLEEKNLDARKIQINLTGFLNGKNARIFTGELWDMLISAQESPTGIPASMVEAKKEEIRKRNEDQERINESVKRTISRYTEKIKDDRDSPPSRRDRSSSKDSPRPTKSTDPDDAAESSLSSSKRNYRSRRSASASPEPNKRKSRSRSGSRDRKNNRDKRTARSRDNSRDRDRDRDSGRRGGASGGGTDRFGRDHRPDNRPRRSRSPRPQRRSRSRSPQRRPRSPPHWAGAGGRASSPPRAVRRRSPLFEPRNSRNDTNYRDAPVTADRDRFRSRQDDRRSRSPTNNVKQRDKPTDRSLDRKDKESKDVPAASNKASKKDGAKKDSESPSSNGTSPENGIPKSGKKHKSSSDSDDKSEDEDQPKKQKKDKKDKKKKEKKHKKHKKHTKKLKKTKDSTKDDKKDSSEEDESEEDDDKGNEENGNKMIVLPKEMEMSFRKLISANDEPSNEDLERRLRERALESMKMKKANMNH
ncbi:serine/arginine repetitive matrix protein 1 isoform X2 [Folsomia candida]|uniref:serine/arginine repetitive matrix protein 1 isoform X2 n=1 Tax=Folsomia candida TaxID=158441 RepID=UPI000B909842|nr:serine/arginine repetitive matrix protein 1 isoform X2 [Folsomia candida]